MNDHTLLDAALAYAARGWQVFPCHTPTPTGCSCRNKECADIGKHPRTQHGCKDATTDEPAIRRWWQMWPQANIGIATGQGSGLVVLDEDSYKGGDVSLQALEQSYAPLPATMQQLTGGGGSHCFFAHPGSPIKNGVENLGNGLDIRGDGGYVIAPPSLHTSGRRYAWEVLHEPDDTPLAPMPAWLLGLCQESVRRDAPDAGAPILQGTRNDTLFRLGCSLRARGCTEAVILAALREMNATQCQPPLAEDDIATLAASCAKYDPGASREDLSQRRNGPGAGAEEAPKDAPDLSQRLARGEYSNTQVFVQAHGTSLRWCEAWHSWLVWTGTHWQRDTSGAVLQKAKATVKAQLRAVELTDDETATAAILKHVNMSLKIAQLEALVKNARSEPDMTVEPEELDCHPWLLNCANGTLDLHTGILRPHAQADMLTKCLEIDYEPEARYPAWAAFLERILGGNPELFLFVQRAIGYSLTGSTREQCMFILHGPTKTGKSTFLATIRALLGPYGQQADMSSFMRKDKEEVRNDLADLAGSRVVCALESQEGKRLSESLVKQITGGVDLMKARFLFQEHFTFRPQFKLFLGTNHKPVIRDTDSAIWERIRLIPFVVQIPKPERDKTLDDKLQQELPGILAWAVRGCMQWQSLGELQEPQAVIDATSGYRTEMDTIARFLDECCIVGKPELPGIKAPLLAIAYLNWCKRTGEFPMPGRTFITDLEERGYVRKKGHANQLYWYGIALSSMAEEMRSDGI